MPKPLLPHAALRLIPKRGDNDCAIVTLASYLRRDPEEVLLAAGKVSPTVWQSGLHCPQMVRVCNRLGVKVRWRKTFDVENDSGVLWVSYRDLPNEHVVLLLDGRIYDADHDPISVWEQDDWFVHYNAYPSALLQRVEE